jgi:integrase
MAAANPTIPSIHIQPKRQRGQGRIFSRKGSPFLWCAYFLRGKEIRESTGETEPRKAERFLNRRMKEIGADQIGARLFAGPQQERVLVNELLDDVEAEYKLGGKRRIPREVSPQMRSHLNRVREHFGAMRAVAVHSHHVQGFVSLLKDQGKQNATVNRSLQLLGQAYRLAVSSDPPKLLRALKVPKLDESGNVRKGKFTKDETALLFASLPHYIADVASFAYEAGSRRSEILKLRWPYLVADVICVPPNDTKNRKPRTIALTPALEEIIERRRAARFAGCDLIFHHDGRVITDFRKCWQTACVLIGLGRFYCRNCKDERGQYISVLDAKRRCPQCRTKWAQAKYIGKLFHDFRRTAAHELWKAGNTVEDCMEVTGHSTPAMFKRYADLFTDEEKQARQREVQQRRRKVERSSVGQRAGDADSSPAMKHGQ